MINTLMTIRLRIKLSCWSLDLRKLLDKHKMYLKKYLPRYQFNKISSDKKFYSLILIKLIKKYQKEKKFKTQLLK